MKNMNMKKWLMSGLLAVAMVLSLVSPARAETASQSILTGGGLSMDVVYGYDDAAKGGRYIPVRITLDNTGDSAFQGELQVHSMESDYDIYRYDYPVTVPEDGSMEQIYYIPLGNRIDQMFINLVDTEDKQILHKRIKLNVSQEIPELFVGILSDTPEALSYMDGIGVDYSMLRTRAFPFTEDTFPEEENGLNLVDVLVVSNYTIRDLSSRQSQVLVDWVRGGGVMILGTGARVDDTLGRFAPELLDESYDPPQLRTVEMNQGLENEGHDDFALELMCADFSMTGSNIIYSDEQMALLASVPYGKGIIAVAAYDFADIGSYCQRYPSYMDTLLTSVLGEDRINKLAETAYSGNSNQYWSANNMINTGNVDRLPNIPLYVMEIIIYIILVGPGLYIFLRQRDLGRYYKRGVVLLSVIFTVIIYLMGSKTRFQDTFFTYARFIDTSEDSVSESAYLNIQTPYNTGFEVNLAPGYSIKPITRSYYDEMSGIPKFTGQEDHKIAIHYDEENTRITAQNMIAFEAKYFELEKVVENTEQIGFTGQIVMYENQVTGSITNNFIEPVEDAAALFYDKMILLGDMEPGETVQLDGMEVLQLPVGHSNQIAEKITGGDTYSKADINNKEYLDALGRTNLLISYLDFTKDRYASYVRVVGVSSEEEPGMFGLESDELSGLTIISSTLSVYGGEDGVAYRSALLKKPAVLSGSYQSANNTLYGIDPLVLEYSLGNDIQVDKLYFDYVSEAFTETVKNSKMQPFKGSLYFYNHSTGNFDKMNDSKTMYTGEELEGYLSPGNTITVKYLYNNVSEYSWDILLPMLNIVGRVY